jgi:Acetyltransferase (GNAT) family
MVAVEQWARERGAATVILTVHAGNHAAEALYAAQGYRGLPPVQRTPDTMALSLEDGSF